VRLCLSQTEVAGFFWWQGDRDSRDLALTEHYESNLVALIKALRLRYKAPNAPFVAASLGQSTLDPSCLGNCGGGILKAEENLADATKYPEFKGNYASVDSHKFTQARRRHFLSHLYIKCIILPRQARDEHRENSKKVPFSLSRVVAPAGTTATTPRPTWTLDRRWARPWSAS
jgi:hypothetical protein